MKRGDIWTIAGGGAYTANPRPAVVVQGDAFAMTDSITVCALTTGDPDAPLFRIRIAPSEVNGLKSLSRLMIDKVTTIPKSKMGARIRSLTDADLRRLDLAMLVFLGLAAPRR